MERLGEVIIYEQENVLPWITLRKTLNVVKSEVNEGGKYAFMGIWHSTKKENFKILQKDDLHT